MWFYWMKIWATCKESVVQLHPHSDSNEWGLVSCWHEAVNSPGFWAGIISGDCSWTYWGAQIVSATGKATPPWGREAQHHYLPVYLVVMFESWAPKCKLTAGGKAARSSSWLSAFFYLCICLFVCSFICLFILFTHCFVNTWEVSVPLSQSPLTTPCFSQG